MLKRLLLSALATGAVLAPAQAQQIWGKTFAPATFIGILQTDALFYRPGGDLEIVPIADLVIQGRQFAIRGGLAETTRWQDVIPSLPAVLYTESGNGQHQTKADLYSSLFCALNLLPAPQTLSSKWVGQSGIQHEVVTVQQEGETTKDFVKRHTTVVDALKAVDPPKKGGP